MPIPTRSQSVSRKVDTGLPIRKPSTRKEPTAAKTSEGSVASRTRSAVTKVGEQEKPSNIAYPRSIPRPPASQIKPADGHARATALSGTTAPTVRPASTRMPGAPSATEAKPQHHARHTSLASTGPRSQIPNVHTRSTSIALAGSTKPAILRPVRPKGPASDPPQSSFRSARSTTPAERPQSASGSTHAIDTSNTRDELLQLKILHQIASLSLESFQHSIEDDKERRMRAILQQQQSLLALEQSVNRDSSLAALSTWFEKDHEHLDGQQLHMLGSAVALIEEIDLDGVSMQPLTDFQAWLADAMILREEREHGDYRERLQFVPSLGLDWRRSMVELQQKCEAILTTLQQLDSPEEGSCVYEVLMQNVKYLRTIVAETGAAIDLERLIMQAETDWETQELAKVMDTLSRVESVPVANAERRRGVWT